MWDRSKDKEGIEKEEIFTVISHHRNVLKRSNQFS